MKNLTDDEVVRKLSSLSTVSGRNDTDDWDDEIFAIQDEILSRLARVQELEGEVERWKERLKTETDLRPVWAQGYSNDSIVAQVSSIALKTLWNKLEVDNQTAAVDKIAEGQRAIKKLESIRALIYPHCLTNSCDTCNSLTYHICTEACNFNYGLKSILAEEG